MERLNDASPGDLADFEAFIDAALRGRSGEERAEIEQYLRSHPGHTVRDWKGKGDPDFLRPAEPEERSWDRLNTAQVQEIATREVARNLPRNVRQAASRDANLVWSSLARRYRFRRWDDPEPEGVSKVPDPTFSRPAAANNLNANHVFECPRGRARGSRGDTL